VKDMTGRDAILIENGLPLIASDIEAFRDMGMQD